MLRAHHKFTVRYLALPSHPACLRLRAVFLDNYRRRLVMKNTPRLALLGLVALALNVFGIPFAQAQWKPTKDVEFVIPYGLGGGADLLARTIIKIIQEEKLTPVAVVAVNKPGGG